MTISDTLEIRLRTKFKYSIEQRAITHKLYHVELQFLYNALFLDGIYPPMKFHDNIPYTLGAMAQTKWSKRVVTQK